MQLEAIASRPIASYLGEGTKAFQLLRVFWMLVRYYLIFEAVNYFF